MKYRNAQQFQHSQAPKVGVMITNLGTPEAPTKGALKTYLRQFLSDPRVVEVARPLWWLILNGIILNTRPAKSAQAYRRVWTDRGSPLALHTAEQTEAVAAQINNQWGDEVVVDWAMRYGQPAIDAVIQRLLDQGVRKLLVLPLYPQYSATTTGSTFDAVAADFTRRRWLPELRFVTQYHDRPEYIKALADSIEAHWQNHGRADKLIFSYHGVPLRYLHDGDPYHCNCLKTTRLVAETLKLSESEYQSTFQSRFGREEWLRPYTDETMETLPSHGVRSVQVICPGFAADCLETIDEIGVENKEIFQEAGGERFEYIPCLNSRPEHINMLVGLIDEQLKGWLPAVNPDPQTTEQLFQQHPYNERR